MPPPGSRGEIAKRLLELERLALPSVRYLLRAQARREVVELASMVQGGDLRARTERLLSRFSTVDEYQLGPLREKLRAAEMTREDLDRELERLEPPDFDAFLEKLFDVEYTPSAPRRLAPELITYHPSPAWAALEVARRLRPEDTFFDLGSGLGKVVLIAALWSDAKVIGIELDEEIAEMARVRAQKIAPRATLITGDVRTADLSSGTDFYLYTPFVGDVLTGVLAQIEAVAWSHHVRLWTLGRVTELIAREGWLEVDLEIETLVRFRSTL